jgi:cell wall-associated NlpC family hydrolase
VASRRWKRLRSGVLIAATAAALAGAFTSSASAAPPTSPPRTSADALAQFKALSAQAGKINEDLLAAQSDLKTKRGQLTKASAELVAAKQAEQQAKLVVGRFQGQVDQFAAASFDGARVSQLAALLTGTSAQDFLNRATMLNDVASENTSALDKLSGAVAEAETAQRQAATAQQQSQAATNAAAKLVSTISARQRALNTQIAQVQSAMARLTAAQRQTLNNVGDTGTFVGPPGAANTALQAALSRRGDTYVWGAAGPSDFDCSGLMLWSYAKAGISLPHSSRVQYTYGKPVAYGAWQPGDLLFFGSSADSIHHVAMYVGNGEIVQAPTTGVPVQVVPVSSGGSDYYGAKRIVG